MAICLVDELLSEASIERLQSLSLSSNINHNIARKVCFACTRCCVLTVTTVSSVSMCVYIACTVYKSIFIQNFMLVKYDHLYMSPSYMQTRPRFII